MSGNSLGKKELVVAVIFLFLGMSIIPSTGTMVEKKFSMSINCDGETLYVGGNGSGNYTRIQDAIDNATNGDTVFVYNGTYYENVIVHKSINLIGENAATTIIDGMHIDDPLWINTSFVDVCGFTVTNSPIDGWSQGIGVIDKKWHGHDGPYITLTDITISGCIVEGNNGGIRLDNTRNVEIAECTIRHNFCNSVYNIYSSHVRIHHCMIEENGHEPYSGGIMVCENPDLGNSEYIEIFNCTITGNVFGGIRISGGSSQVSVHHNEIYGNPKNGISVRSSSVNIYGNHIFDNGMGVLWDGGIYLSDCINCVTIKENDIASNNLYGLYLMRSSGNSLIKNNFVNNRCNAFFSGFSFFNHWNRNNWKKNYWDRPRLLPYPIFGKMTLGKIIIPWVNFDWHPSQEPYDVPEPKEPDWDFHLGTIITKNKKKYRFL